MPSNPGHLLTGCGGAFAGDEVYGAAAALIESDSAFGNGGIHIDIGSISSRVAVPAAQGAGVTHVACRADPAALAALAQRGFETHRLILGEEDAVFDALGRIIAGRDVACITVIDALEYLDDPAATLRALGRIAAAYDTPILVSVPNAMRRDAALLGLFGQAGGGPRTGRNQAQRTWFSAPVLQDMLTASGLRVLASNDVVSPERQDRLTAEHPAVQSATYLNQMLSALYSLHDQSGGVRQFLKLCTAVPAPASAADTQSKQPERPFLSVVLRTQGRRCETLTETLLCLAAQTVTAFEVLVIAHAVDPLLQQGICDVVADLPFWLRGKTRVIQVEGGGRARPLNVGFAAALGRYIVILDDDDAVFANWVESFQTLAEAHDGQILRIASAVQIMRRVETQLGAGIRSESGFEFPFPSRFDWFEHLRVNHSPGMALAFPRGLFHQLNIKFDESLSTMEDWDYLLRAASLVGVGSAAQITAIYRKWIGAENSFTVHSREEWELNTAKIWAKIDSAAAVIWPIGSTMRLRRFLDDIGILEERARSLESTREQLAALQAAMTAAERTQQAERLRLLALLEERARSLESTCEELATLQAAVSAAERAQQAERLRLLVLLEERARSLESTREQLAVLQGAVSAAERAQQAERLRLLALQDVANIFNSASWQLTAPMRAMGMIFGRAAAKPADIWYFSTSELHDLAARLRRSRSWRLSAGLRRLERIFSRMRAGRRG